MPVTMHSGVVNPNQLDATCIVQAGEYAQAIGKVRLKFDALGQLQYCNGHNNAAKQR